jgi:cytochrome c
MAFGNSIKPHLYTVTQKAEELKKEIEGKTISTTGVDPEAIYNTKCIACHKFDVKLVGPPYQETVPKYAGDVKKLAEFIYNPQKINPAFPPMPNQGLKQKEADAMAQWLIKKVSGK